ncbi:MULTISPECIES: AzlC family ABC transporter permease [Spiribacter]|jgi:4-azaleucine resistance transporter AzlC|uniref:Branched-chain amino acid ABC transporter permease n=1 Tax=Spiribacter aquaticus TaxID=1935996 RepID=A0A557RM85_9GAMM|nr:MULTISPECIES: AzlC family ABC transporter permease [Spiribacter]PYZ99529.1 branched-chain amino acid ABC transporter permease [Gammaproteobacteria bacterium 2W06]AUB79060.1 branched-chain amino acid ABC transporter permease [Spiribacter roseus]KAF0279247.1 branched-chain amino acid ABC transporter permease [Spiribacter roseus]KAF0284592.1 branched-chain amino acid ABC transporter permease [Spiribacter roseus]KAF0286569.1 branched-chain amino acid ABC transporter permease [Spiribacter sp. SS
MASARQQAFSDGLKAVAPMVAAIVPFGVTAGVAGLDAGLGAALTLGMSLIVFAGASQLASIQLIDAGAAAPLVVLTALIINLRMLMYSAHLAPHFRHVGAGSRSLMAYILTDQAYALTISRVMTRGGERFNHWFYFGVALPLWGVWQLATAFGYWAGTAMPPAWELGFIVPLIFLALLVMSISSRPGVIAALVAGSLSVLGRDLPAGLGLTLASLAGIVAGVVAEGWRRG